jgi:hypothetical protein
MYDGISVVHKAIYEPVPIKGWFYGDPFYIMAVRLQYRKNLAEIIGELFPEHHNICLIDDPYIIIV